MSDFDNEKTGGQTTTGFLSFIINPLQRLSDHLHRISA